MTSASQGDTRVSRVVPAGGRVDRRSARASALVGALEEVRARSLRASEALVEEVPDTGDHLTGRVVDDFVDQAIDTLRALAETVTETLGDAGSRTRSGLRTEPTTAAYGVPRGWRR